MRLWFGKELFLVAEDCYQKEFCNLQCAFKTHSACTQKDLLLAEIVN